MKKHNEVVRSDIIWDRQLLRTKKTHSDDGLTIGASSEHPIRTGLDVGADETRPISRSRLSASSGSVLFS